MLKFVLPLLKSKIPGWSRFEDARRDGLRKILTSLANDSRLAGASPADLPAAINDHLEKALDASLPIHELGAEALVALAELLRSFGKK